ncbi:MAG TPA: hypothetical protein DCM38_13395 [Gammaproteobacteria bacterium]|nr:hypothetical protein [Gammaproteobacteria bacterium]
MQQFTLKLDDPMLETALNSIAQEQGKDITDVIRNAIAYFVNQKYVHFKKLASSLSENNSIINENALALSEMASDPQIQTELKNIEAEFSRIESDGLEKSVALKTQHRDH